MKAVVPDTEHSLGELVKTQTDGPPPPVFLVYKVWVGLENLHFFVFIFFGEFAFLTISNKLLGDALLRFLVSGLFENHSLVKGQNSDIYY